jgi:hypothetical protein
MCAPKQNPGRRLPLLEPPYATCARHKQESVANWTNAAAEEIMARHLSHAPREQQQPATRGIVT